MKDTITQRLDDKDIEYANLLRKMGFGMCAAKVAVALKSGSKTQKELAICIDENQSAISIALRNLIKGNLVNVSEKIPLDGQGRPQREYILVLWKTVIDTIEKETIRKHESENAQIEKLKELIH